MKIISTKKAPVAIGPYSQAINIGNFIFTSGQIPINPETEKVPDGIELQSKQICENIKAILDASESSLQNVIKTTCYLTDMSNFEIFNKIYAQYFMSKPARSCFAVKALPKGVLCEIEAIAIID